MNLHKTNVVKWPKWCEISVGECFCFESNVESILFQKLPLETVLILQTPSTVNSRNTL